MKLLIIRSAVTLAVIAAISAVAAPAFAKVSDAEGILRATGVQGGLVVHLGCGDGQLTADLCSGDAYLVHGLDRDRGNVDKARKHIRERALYGSVSVDQLLGQRLPYADNLVNLLVTEDSEAVSNDEVMRVLAPGGVAYQRTGDTWKKTVNPLSEKTDEWTHFLHDATGNAVASDDLVGPPRRLQWAAEPKWARSHEHLATISAVVSSGGRLFYIADEGPTASVALPASWSLVARDAFNGLQLWKQPIETWESHHRPFRSGPAQLPRRLVAVDDRVYVTLGYGEPVAALDAATGKTVREFPETAGATEILYQGGMLFVVVGGGATERPVGPAERRGETTERPATTVLAIRAETGDVLWKKTDEDTSRLLPLTLAVDGRRAVFQNTREIVCLDAQSGSEQWRADRPAGTKRPAWAGPTLVLYKDVVLSADRAAPKTLAEKKEDVSWSISFSGGGTRGELVAFSAASGERLWSAPCAETYNAPPDILVADGLVWTGALTKAKDPGITVARDVQTGEVRRERPVDQKFFQAGMSHHRCYRNKATDKFLLLGRAGVEFVDVQSGDAAPNHWVRGSCQYGIMPANGLLYAPPHSCACFLKAKLNGFNALSSQPLQPGEASGPRLEHGPAFGKLGATKAAVEQQQMDWPTYRHDAARSGHTKTPVPAKLRQAWRSELGGRLSSPVFAEGKVFVAQVDQHTVHALDGANGKSLWSYTVGGRVDSPPTVVEGLVFFGSADGWVYCLRAADGQLAWRFRGWPQERHVVSYGQLESTWPVSGSVTVQDGEVIFAAGRSSYLDGGIRLVRLKLHTGEVLSETILDNRDPKTGNQPAEVVHGFGMEGSLADVLSSDGESIFMRHVKFDRQGNQQPSSGVHLFSLTGFLDDTWWHRSYWMYGSDFSSGWGGWWRAGNRVPAGKLLVFDDASIYGFGRSFIPGGNAGQWNKGEFYQVFATSREPVPAPAANKNAPADRRRGKKGGQPAKPAFEYFWKQRADIAVRSMVLADRTLFVAGTVGATHQELDAFEGKKGHLLRALSAEDGKSLAEYPLDAAPVFDGLIAAAGSLFMTTQDGSLICMSAQ